ncbi:Zn-dependent hydrolase [Mesorhizobium sp. VK22B]|uniref:Zn-dependent hydrolase n=1 Tax=Mesorhizobium captivum TaxID=3072319 RepID=A0ABU4YZZ0_9HYPH|nr:MULTISPECIES: Zn-dependent hydrolase [unclassified Mesorhizobium]MDX8492520.1 Zn-dependent hydrolase [Mesorhizobium sp. VK22B]MDX8505609.1 Zn-dependent hydrolase [Mesorhizobium sp. VK22E]
MSEPRIDAQRFLSRLDAFALIGATPKGGVNRQALSPEDRRARRLLAELGQARGFSVGQDAIANLFIRREGKDNSRPPFLIGSHLDSQLTGGRFDGALGTLAAFEVLEALEDAGVETPFPVEAVAWTNEEGSHYQPGCMGSMAFASGSIPQLWTTLRGHDGSLFADELQATLEALPQAAMRPLGFPIAAYLELHIEQGPSLESENIPIGIVEGIQGTRWLEVEITGQSAHAGTTALALRRDAMAAAVRGLGSLYAEIMPCDARARFTVGKLVLEPGAVNAIPEKVAFTIDLRHPESAVLDRLETLIRNTFAEAAAGGGCASTLRRIFDMPPTVFSPLLLERLNEAADSLGLASKSMLSGAFHDALFVNRVAPTAMIFVPCRDGLSHNEAEYVEPDQAVAGARMLLASTLKALENR